MSAKAGRLMCAHARPSCTWGFTLVEVMTTVIIIGILSSIAVPNFLKTVDTQRWRSAQDLLMTIYTGEQVYFTKNDLYYTPGTWLNIFMDDPNQSSGGAVIYSVTSSGVGSAAVFTATALRTGGQNECMSVNEKRELAFSSTDPACIGGGLTRP